jgi:hypothetical protein
MELKQAKEILNDSNLSSNWLINCLATNNEEYLMLNKIKELVKKEMIETFEEGFKTTKFFANQR